MNSSRVLGSFMKAPVKSLVVVTLFCFCTPRIDMHICWASMTTATPNGAKVFCMQSFICLVRRSCTCSLRAYASTAQTDDGTVGYIGYMRLADERNHVVLAEGIEFNVLYYHHLAVIFMEHR